MLEGYRRIHPIFALAGLLGCAISCLCPQARAQSIYPWPGVMLLAHEEADNFQFQLGMACTAAVRADRLGELKELYRAGGPEFVAQDEYARNMLYYAAELGSYEMNAWLLSPEGGRLGDVKFMSIAGRTPLELAAEAGREGRVMELLKEGAPEELLQIASERGARKGFDNVKHPYPPSSMASIVRGASPLADRVREKGLTERERRDYIRIRLAFFPDADFALETSEAGGLPLRERELLAQDAVLLMVEAGRAPEVQLLERMGTPELWAERGARAFRRAVVEQDGSVEKLWPLAEMQGWIAQLSFRDLALMSASYRKPQNFKYALSLVDERTMFTLAPGEPSLVEIVLEQLDLECLALLRARYPERDLLTGFRARQIFDRFFWDNVAPPPAIWRPYLKSRAAADQSAPLAWEENLAAQSQKRTAFLAAVEKLGLKWSSFPPDDLGEVLKAVLWLQDEPLYRAISSSTSPAQRSFIDENGWSLGDWERLCGIQGPP